MLYHGGQAKLAGIKSWVGLAFSFITHYPVTLSRDAIP